MSGPEPTLRDDVAFLVRYVALLVAAAGVGALWGWIRLVGL